MKKILITLCLVATACSEPQSTNPQISNPEISNSVIKLYDGVAPGSEDWDWPEYKYTDAAGESYFTNITDPELIAFLPPAETATGAAMVVCPGGSFMVNYYTKEGANVAQWLAEHGVAAFVLKYRLVHFARNEEEAFYEVKGTPAPVYTEEEKQALAEHRPIARALGNDDGRAAIAYIRKHASDFGVDPDRIGIIGFSAGAFLACDVALNHTEESRPNLIAPIYGAATHLPEILPEDAAPLFVAAPEIDLFKGLTGYDMMKAWREAEIPAEAHYFACDQHGFGYYPQPERRKPSHIWIDLLYAFMEKTGFLGE